MGTEMAKLWLTLSLLLLGAVLAVLCRVNRAGRFGVKNGLAVWLSGPPWKNRGLKTMTTHCVVGQNTETEQGS